VVVNSWDVTERKRVEDEVRALNADLERRVVDRTRELAQANERLQELDRLKSKFVSDVSHELLTPITNMNLYLSLFERARVEEYPAHIGTLKEHTRQLTDLVEDILDLSRLEREREHAEFSPVDLNAVAQRVVEANRVRAEAAGLSLAFAPGVDLPLVRGDRDMLARAVANLLTNAINYTPKGMIRVSIYQDNGHVCLQVEDTGIGIDTDDLPHVFERFYRGRRAARVEASGTGLGLSIVEEIVAMHDGEAHVRSHADEGSAFVMCLPCAAVGDEVKVI
jgi:two-component system phosphate regulon sensor histidine kinase PhoR